MEDNNRKLMNKQKCVWKYSDDILRMSGCEREQ